MNGGKPSRMRDLFLARLYDHMKKDDKVFFVAADFGAPKLDDVRRDFPDRFINVGIAEQNLINVSTGLALEGFTVFSYAIAPFLTMRAYEQIRVNLSLHAQVKTLNVNLVGVGAGISYDVSGPTHHCLEDLTIMRTLPNFAVFSPADAYTAERYFDSTISVKTPKYLRFDAKPMPRVHEELTDEDIRNGFKVMHSGKGVCLVSTGIMTHKAASVAKKLAQEGLDIGAVDVFLVKAGDEKKLFEILTGYDRVITLEEGFVEKGGLDGMVSAMLDRNGSDIRLKRLGFQDRYVFEMGDREYLHGLNGLDEESIVKTVKEWK